MTCLALKMRQLLMLLVIDFTVGAYLPTRETTFQEASDSTFFSKNRDRLHVMTSIHNFHPLIQTALADTVPSSQLSERKTVESLPGNLASEVRQDYVNNDGLSTTKKETHRIKTRSSSSDIVSRTDSDFVFPVKSVPFIPKQDVRNCSEDGTDLCVSNVKDYPYHHIERLLQNKTSHFRSYFTEDIVDVKTRFDSTTDNTDEELTCDAEETILYPKFGKTATDETLFIVNIEGKYRQGIRVEKCKKTGKSPCNPKLEAPIGYRTYCKQKYIYRKLLALHPTGEPAPDNFKIPSCCSCFISKETN